MKETIYEQGFKAEIEVKQLVTWSTLMLDYTSDSYRVTLKSKILTCKSEMCNQRETVTIKEMYKSFFKTAAENKVRELTIDMIHKTNYDGRSI